MSMRKHIDALRKKRNACVDAMSAASESAAAESRLFTADEQTAWDKDQAEVRDIDATLVKLEEGERQAAGTAKPSTAPGMPEATTTHVEVKAFKPFAGQGFVRMVMATAFAKGNMYGAADYAKRWNDQTPEVETVLRAIAQTGQSPAEVYRAAVAAGTSGNATWAGPLVYAQNLTQEFIDVLRPATILGKLPLRPVPFNVSIPRQTAGATAGWVGEGLSKPVSPLAFDRLSIPWAKTAVISVITEELARFSDPSAEMLVRDDLVAAIVLFLDQQFTDPTVAPAANLRPGAITNGTGTQVLVVPSTGVTIAAILTDVTNLLKQMASKNLRMTTMRWIMNPAARITLATIRGAMDQYAFPEIAAGQFRGYPYVESTAIPLGVPAAGQCSIILVDCNEVFHASDPVIDVSASNEASLQMDSAPATPPTPLVSLWQQNMLGIKAEQYQYWARRRDAVVGMITAFQT